ncbi:MAG: tRNA uridine-5-carboxymethylaminomethyl(34) synthesis GTPase MnmE [Pseudomonadota bacterium]|jgi:tRNA modification GTPase
MAGADIIAAIATAPGRGGIGVVRISGRDLRPVAKALLGKVPAPRYAVLGNFRDENEAVIDQGIALYFPAPHSFTGEDVLELQGHGGNAVLQLLLRRCLALGARLAEPGEFTKRAFLNDKIDLAQAESVADLIDAATAEAAKSAMRSLQGEFSGAIHGLVEELVNLRMLVEAALDFPDEDIEFLEGTNAVGRLSAIQSRLDSLLAGAKQGSLLREGLNVVLIGQPNVGKSSLMNRLAEDEVAIVAPVPGTTRDTVRELIEINGVPLHIIDTAGLRETQDEVEKIGIARTWAAVERATIALLLVDARQGVADSDRAIMEKLPDSLQVVQVLNKIDLLPQHERGEVESSGDGIYVSAKTGEGIERLRDRLLEIAGWRQFGEGTFMARERHLVALKEAQAHLEAARENFRQFEFFAEELKLAQNALSKITGEYTADDLLGEIFSRFCIGK